VSGTTGSPSYFDLSLRHEVDLRRATEGQLRDLLRSLDDLDLDLEQRIRSAYARGLPGNRSEVRRLRGLMDAALQQREAALRRLGGDLLSGSRDVAGLSAQLEFDALVDGAAGLGAEFAPVNTARVLLLVDQAPLQGKPMSEWVGDLPGADRSRLGAALTAGLVAGDTLEQLVRRVRGTPSASYADGAAAVTHRAVETLSRTASNHAGNSAREALFAENSDIIKSERWVSTLDGRTSAFCRAQDGKEYPVGVGPRPPAHFNCRSIMVAVIEGVGDFGERPFVRSAETPQDRNAGFLDEARREAGSSWADMSPNERRRAIAAVRRRWNQENVGRVPASTTYQDWLSKQPASFQDDVLGAKRGALFRRGGLRLDQFVVPSGKTLTLEQLRQRYPSAWSRAFG